MLQQHARTPYRAPHQCAAAGQKFFHVKRFGQIIICTQIKPVNPVLGGFPRRQDQDRHIRFVVANGPQKLQTILTRQPQIQNNQVKFSGSQSVFCQKTVIDPVHDKFMPLQKSFDCIRNQPLVLNQQYAHVFLPLGRSAPNICLNSFTSTKNMKLNCA